jgi:1,4-alpha-glucan branching enzyme
MWQLDHDHRGFTWIDGGAGSSNVLTFLRWDEAGEPIAVAINFAGHPHYDWQLGLPRSGDWVEILNTDAETFGGSGAGNMGKVEASGEGSHGQPHSAKVNIPPLGAVWFKPAK